MVELVEAERAKFEDLLEELGTSLPPPLYPQIRQPSGARGREDADECSQVTHAHRAAEKRSPIKTRQPKVPIPTTTVPIPMTHMIADRLHDLQQAHHAQHTIQQEGYPTSTRPSVT
jgi:hypothetical protein